MKRNRIMGAVIIAVLLIGVLVYRYANKSLEQYTATFLDVFHTSTTIIGYAEDEASFREDVALLKEKLEYYHRLYDIYNDYEDINNIKTINDNAGVAPVEVSSDIIDLLLYSKEMYRQTNGQMNVVIV